MNKNKMKLKYYGDTYNLQLYMGTYNNNNNLAIEIIDVDTIEPFTDLSVNIAPLPKNQFCVDINNFKEGIDLIKKYDLAIDTGLTLSSGFCSYPVYELNIENAKKYMYMEE